MKKHGLLLLIVLTLSTTAWANPQACVQINPACPTCAEDVSITVLACILRECSVVRTDYHVCQTGMILVDVYLECTPCGPGGSTKVDETVNVGDLCPGWYMVLARVHCSTGSCFWGSQICAVGTNVFRVSCASCPQPKP